MTRLLALLLLVGCSHTVELAKRVPEAAQCHKLASDHIQTAKSCLEAQAAARAEPSCKEAYPDGVNLNCKEIP